MVNKKTIVKYDNRPYIIVGYNVCRGRILLCRWNFDVTEESVNENAKNLPVEVEIDMNYFKKLKILLERK